MAVEKVCISLHPETLAQMEYIAHKMRLNPCIKRSQLLQQIVYELYMRMQSDSSVLSDDIDDYFV